MHKMKSKKVVFPPRSQKWHEFCELIVYIKKNAMHKITLELKRNYTRFDKAIES